MFTLVVWFALSGYPSDMLTPINVKQFDTMQECMNAMPVIHANAYKLEKKPEAYSCVKTNKIM